MKIITHDLNHDLIFDLGVHFIRIWLVLFKFRVDCKTWYVGANILLCSVYCIILGYKCHRISMLAPSKEYLGRNNLYLT